MSIRNLIFGVDSVSVSYLIRYDSLLQNATDAITKCDSYFITKYDKVYYKMRQVFHYKCDSFTKCDNFIAKCDSYYKMRSLLQIATVQCLNPFNAWCPVKGHTYLTMLKAAGLFKYE